MRFLFSLSLLFASAAMAAQPVGIAAIVNDEVISTIDLQRRVQLALGTTGQPITQESVARVQPQLLQSMINDTLQLQEAERYSILVSPSDVRGAVAAIEQQQGKSPGSLQAYIEQSGLSFDSFKQQMKSQVAWRKLLARRVRRDITVSDEEVQRAQRRMARGRSIPEVKIASVLLPPQEKMDAEALLAVARDIRSQLVSGKQAAELLAEYDERLQLEFAPVTWIARSKLAPQLRDLLAAMSPGQIAEPIVTPLGVQIIRLIETRTLKTVPSQNAEVAIKQIILKLDDQSSDIEIDSKMDIARSISKYPGSCQESGVAGLQQFEGLRIDVNYFRTTTASMAPDVRTMVEPLPVTGITQPFASEDGIHLLMLCERISVPAPLPEAEKVKAALFDEKLQLEAEKYMRRLRREAFIDVRI